MTGYPELGLQTEHNPIAQLSGLRGAKNDRDYEGQIQRRELSFVIFCGQTTVSKRAPICYIIPINDMVHRPL